MSNWQVCVLDNDYEINTSYPHQIRRIRNKRIISEFVNDNKGYIRCAMNGKKYYKHRIIATQFIPNTNNLSEVDHINQVRSDNRIENLRWCSCSDNNKNKASCKGKRFEYIDELPDDSIPIHHYNGWLFDDLFYSPSTEKFYKDIDVKIRVINILEKCHCKVINARDVENKNRMIYLNKFLREYDFN